MPSHLEGASSKVEHSPTPPIMTLSPPISVLDLDESVKEINQCCLEHRVMPHWLTINEPKFGRTQGCALRIRLSTRVVRVWSVDTTYASPADAKKACAELALAEGVLQYVRQHDPQGAPEPHADEAPFVKPRAWSVQEFFETLPQPLPEPVQNKSALDINGPAWLNTTIQSARGGKLVPNFVWTSDPGLGMHGCLLRLERPGECKSFLVDARFCKRAEAKAAVCLQAMSDGVGEYIRGIGKAVENKLSVVTRKQVTDVILPALLAEYRNVRPGLMPSFDFSTDQDACGCTLLIELLPSPAPEMARQYVVPPEYRNRNDAKIAVVNMAAEQGVIEFIRFRGCPPPPGYTPFYMQCQERVGANVRKRKTWDGGHNGGAYAYKKTKFNNGGMQGNFSGGTDRPGNGYHPQAWNNSTRQHNGEFARPHVPGPSHFGNVGGPARAAQPASHWQSGPRNVGGSMVPAPSPAPISAFGGVAPQGVPSYNQRGLVNGGDQAAHRGAVAPRPPPFEAPPASTYNTSTSSVVSSFYGAPGQGATATAYPSYYPSQAMAAPAPQYQQPYDPRSAAYATPYASQAVGYQGYPSASVSSAGYFPVPTPPNVSAYYHPGVSTATNSPAVPAPAYTPYAPTVGAPQAVVPQVPAPSRAPAVPVPVPNPPPQAGSSASTNTAPAQTYTPTPQASSTPPISSDHKPPVKRARPAAKPAGAKVGAASGSGKVTIAVESAPKTSVTALYDYCASAGLPNPQFYNEIVKGEKTPGHKVWVIIGKQKLELSATFPSLSQGQERVAKRVLEQLRAQSEIAMTAQSVSPSSSSVKAASEVYEEALVSLEQYDPELIKKTWRKVDFRILPIAVLLYLASYIDRANVGNAKVLGMATSLHLTDNQYNWVLSIFFIGYVVFETPSNILLRRLSPRWYIPTLTVLWGLTCALFAVVHNATGLIVIRFFLGMAEAGFLPGIVYWMSLTGAFGGLLATAIHALNGTHGIEGWRWIYIVEGCITGGFGLLTFVFMSAYPAEAKFLNATEKRIIQLAIEADRAQGDNESFNGKHIRSAFTDWRTYLVILSLPSVVVGLGYVGTRATLMACPPYGLGFFIVLIAGWTCDRYGKLFYHYVGAVLVVMVALIVLMTVDKLVVRYVMFFLVMFMFIPVSVCWTWLSSNIAGSNKRAAATGVVFSLGSIGGTVSGQIYRAEWAPRYVQGHAINLACYVIALVSGFALWYSYKRDNERRDREANEKVAAGTLVGADLGDLGDRHPNFRYYL
ncbi:putative transporter C11D3.18C [Grifola frondosa]|uniref:Putative transporter C11D3.18C n=1 Tax=Grifola frondosa TaxID=5627 RepID=A0A1C7M913_GRIFR|nr:putative transporter C11D3.18C [Grifola frondosa]